MGKIDLSEIVNMPAFEEAGALFHKATGMTLSFYNDQSEVVFYPSGERCEFCRMIQSSSEGYRLCQESDSIAAEAAFLDGKPRAYTCHAGLVDVVVPVVVGEERIGCFYSGQSLHENVSTKDQERIAAIGTELGLDIGELWNAYKKVQIVDEQRLKVAMGLLGVICNHLVDSEIALRRERLLTKEQRKFRKAAEEKAQLERDLREMELRLVQAQLNPHFLFNALNLILGNAMAEKANQTRKLVENLSVLLRSSLAQVGKMVTLQEEIASTAAYIDIHLARFRRDISYEINLPEELSAVSVPPMILQPVVENSLVHGLEPDKPLSLLIDVRRFGATVNIRISDTGKGLPDTGREELQTELDDIKHRGKTTGLIGLARRLSYYYPGKSGILIKSNNPGLLVVVSIPDNQ